MYIDRVLITESFQMSFSDGFFIIMVIAVLFDYMTGVASAVKRRDLSSKIGSNGLIKHSIMIILAFTIVTISYATSTQPIGYLIIIAYLLQYTISVMENLEAIGLPVPKWVKKYIRTMRDKSDNNKLI